MLCPSQGTKYIRESDLFWVNAKAFLEKSGYRIPPVFDLAYTPSTPSEKRAAKARLLKCILMEAVRLRDQVPVVLKQVAASEAYIATYFSSLPEDPRNHCVPIYEVLRIDSRYILVMPLLRPCHRPSFDTVGEVLECFRQLFEGIQFMHKHRTSHGDPILWNLMMSGDKMYPKGFSAARPYRGQSDKGYPKAACTRAECWPRYYIIDFEYSKRFPESYQGVAFNEQTDADRTPGQNPFPNDIHYLGQFLKRYFMHSNAFKRRHLEFLRPLVADMLHETPSLRPTIDDVVLRFSDILKSTKNSHMRQVIQPTTRLLEDVWSPFQHVYLRTKYMLLRTPPIPKDILPPIIAIPPRMRDFYTQPRYGDEEGPERLQERIHFRSSHYKPLTKSSS